MFNILVVDLEEVMRMGRWGRKKYIVICERCGDDGEGEG